MSDKLLVRTAGDERSAFSARLREALQNAGCPAQARAIASHCARAMPGSSITEQSVSKWLRGEAMPTQARLRALAAATGVTPEWLRFGPPGGRARVASEPAFDPWRAIAFDLAKMSASEIKLVEELVKLLLRRQLKSKRASRESAT